MVMGFVSAALSSPKIVQGHLHTPLAYFLRAGQVPSRCGCSSFAPNEPTAALAASPEDAGRRSATASAGRP